MKCVEAVWERRNLGRNAFEVSLNKTDLKDIGKVLDGFSDPKYEGAYVTLKVPVGDLACVHAIEDAGFRFLETQIGILYDLRKYRTPDAIVADLEPLSIHEVPHDAAEWRKVVDRITPELFETDRISQDPLLGPDVGCRRYRNWIMDLVANPQAHLLLFGNPEVPAELYGFSVDKLNSDTGVVHGILAGVFSDCGKPGIGISIWDASFRNAVVRGATMLQTAISSNNPAVVALDSVLGVEVRKLTYVFRRQF